MKCAVCGREFNKFEEYINLSIAMYVHANKDDWKKRWEKLPKNVKEFYGSFEKYLDEKTLSLIDIIDLRICLDCIKKPKEVGKIILEELRKEEDL